MISSSLSPSRTGRKLKNVPVIEATGAVIVLGGTSARLVITTKDGKYPKLVQIKWEEFLAKVKEQPAELKQAKNTHYHLREILRLQGLSGDTRLRDDLVRKIEEKLGQAGNAKPHALADRFCHSFAQEILVALENSRVDLSGIKDIRFSIAGVVHGNGVRSTITTFNTGVAFQKYRIAEKLLEHLPQLRPFIRHVEVLNDGYAGALGELFHEQGKLKETEGGLFVIAGTGVGGAQVKLSSHKVVMRNRNEFGKTFFLDSRTLEWRHISLRKQKRDGLLHDGVFRVPEGLVPAEHLLAGPWVAVNYVKSLEPAALRRLAAELAARELQNKGISASRSKLASKARWWYDALTDLEGKSLRDPSRWSIEIRDTVIRPVTQYLLEMKHSRYVAHRHGVDPQSRLVQDTWKYMTTIEELWGGFIKIMRKTYPDARRAVLAGGVAEAFGKLPNFIEAIEAVSGCPKGFVQITALDGETRESAGVSEMAKLTAERGKRQKPRNLRARLGSACRKLEAVKHSKLKDAGADA